MTDLSNAARGGVRRRDAVIGSAWGITAVVLSARVPARAVSGPTVAFAAPAYSGPPCGEISGIRVTSDVAGRVIALQLSDGYTFSGGSVSSTVVTGADGTADVGAVAMPAHARSSTIVASTPGAPTASATLLPTSTAGVFTAPSGRHGATTMPGVHSPVAGDLFLSDSTLRRVDNTVVQTDVDVVGLWAPSLPDDGGSVLPLRLHDGSAVVYDQVAQSCSVVAGVPAGATPVASDIFFSDGSLVRGSSVVATDVARYGALVNVDDGTGTPRAVLPYTTTDGRAALLRASDGASRISPDNGSPVGVPSGSVPVAGDLFLSGGVLYRVSWNGSHAFGVGAVARDVATYGLLTPNPYFEGELLMPYIDSRGSARLFMYSGNATREAPGIPAGATPIGADLFLVGTVLIAADTGATVSDVGAVGQVSTAASSSNVLVVPYTTTDAAC